LCENSTGPNKTCDFRAGKVILQQPVDPEQMKKLLITGKTDLLPRFISRKGRPFKAFLVQTEKKDVGFEFEKREPKTKKELKHKRLFGASYFHFGPIAVSAGLRVQDVVARGAPWPQRQLVRMLRCLGASEGWHERFPT